MGKTESSFPKLTKSFIGYGHYRLIVTFSDCVKTALTGNMDLIDRLNSDIEKEREEATAEAIAFAKNNHFRLSKIFLIASSACFRMTLK